MGDPAGIGPEIIIKALSHPSFNRNVDYVLFCDYRTLLKNQKALIRKKIKTLSDLGNCPFITIVDLKNLPLSRISYGHPSKEGGRASGEYIKAAVEWAKKGLIDGIVTAPINKTSFYYGGWGRKYPGHTEMLADLTGVKSYALMMVVGKLRSIHVTSHISLAKVSPMLKLSKVIQTIELAKKGCVQLGIPKPRIGVAGLNPHAGENGMMGREEDAVILPAIKTCQKRGFFVKGPIPSDTLWPQVASGLFDIGVAMYHDQGQIPIKMLGVETNGSRIIKFHGVNVTVGLPFVRTSVAHGTAFDIAGQMRASCDSMLEAIRLAEKMIRINKRKNGNSKQ